MRILMVTPEWAPVAKVGGLADAAAALSDALAKRGHDVRVVLPLYGHLDRTALGLRPIAQVESLPLRVGQNVYQVHFYQQDDVRDGVTVYFAECDALFSAEGVYAGGYEPVERLREPAGAHPLERASLHAQAALVLPAALDWPVDVLHCHDAQASLAAVYRRRWYGARELPGRASTLLTIHNLAHQEIYSSRHIETLGLPSGLAAYPGAFEFHGNLNLLKAGILTADLVNTVSPTYAHEVVADPAFGCGLEGVLAGRDKDFSGILNGADYSVWDPSSDPALPFHYSAKNLGGKGKCRNALVKELDLDPRWPLVGMVGRLVPQKGFQLVLPVAERMVAGGATLVVLATGDPEIQRGFERVAAARPGRIRFIPEFNEALARRIYAGCDLFLMPSLFEPCGLAQMYALRYAAPPVVRATGGLADTVVDAAKPAGTGFVFQEAHPEAVLDAVRRAQLAFANPSQWQAIVARGLVADFSWDEAADGYEALYGRLIAAGSTLG